MSYSPINDVYAAPQEGGFQFQQNEQFQLTPEEIQVLKDCSREGVIQRAVPLGVIGGMVGLMGAKSGPLMSAKFGVKPAVIGLGLIGYFIGRISYSSICFNRALEVPNGNIRKFYKNKKAAREYVDPANKYYATIEPTREPEMAAQTHGIDIELPTTSSFDTIPSEYYQSTPEQAQPRDAPQQNYTSYDELRRQNRREYSDRMYNETVRRSPQPPEGGLVRRPAPPPSYQPPSDQPSGNKTKYGDVWDV